MQRGATQEEVSVLITSTGQESAASLIRAKSVSKNFSAPGFTRLVSPAGTEKTSGARSSQRLQEMHPSSIQRRATFTRSSSNERSRALLSSHVRRDGANAQGSARLAPPAEVLAGEGVGGVRGEGAAEALERLGLPARAGQDRP